MELAPKSKHRDWIWNKKTTSIVYICGNEEGRRRIQRANDRVDVVRGYRLRIELLDTIKAQTRAEFHRARADDEATPA